MIYFYKHFNVISQKKLNKNIRLLEMFPNGYLFVSSVFLQYCVALSVKESCLVW